MRLWEGREPRRHRENCPHFPVFSCLHGYPVRQVEVDIIYVPVVFISGTAG